MPPLLPGRRWGNRGRPAGRHAPRLPAALCVLRRPGSHGEWGGGAGAGHFPGRAATTCPQALGTGLATPRSPTSGRRMDSVPDSPPAQGPHPAAPGPSPSCPITRRAIGAPQLRQPRDCAVGRGHSEAGTARPARPVWRLTGVCLGGCGDARASGPGRGGAGMRRVFPAPAPLINKGSGHGRVGPVL